jgi:pheromone shutdown protein TraB
MAGLWKTWISIWCWGVILFGVLLAGAAFPATDAGVRILYGVLSSHPMQGDFLAAPGIRFSIALMGAVSIGWGCTVLFLLPVIHAAGAPAWRGLTAALAVWFVIDGTLSAATGFPLNNVPNLALAIGYIIPLFASGVLKSST